MLPLPSDNPANSATTMGSRPRLRLRQRHCLALITVALWVAALSASSSPTSELRRRSNLAVEKRDVDVLVSPDGTFSCGFFQVGGNAFTFSIWYNPAKFTRDGSSASPSWADVVWSANRDRPVNGRSSRVLLQGRNLLVLIDGYDDSVVWTTAAVTANNYIQGLSNVSSNAAEKAELQNSGNLVLKDSGGKILWQSFDSPTNTILPGQPFTKTTRLTASVSSSSLASGSNALIFDKDNVLRLISDGPSNIYWPDPDKSPWVNGRTPLNNSRSAVIDLAGSFFSSDRLNFTASDHDVPINTVRRRLTLDADGNLRLYSRRTVNINDEMKNEWYVSWQAMMNTCQTHGLCGKNGICIFGLKPVCTCPPGYSRVNLASWKDGCRPNFTTAGDSSKNNNYFCYSNGNNGSYQFVELPHADFYGSNIQLVKNVSLESCKNICEQDCNCQAFQYRKSGEGYCFPKATLFNGYSSLAFLNMSLFLKLPKDLPGSLPNISENLLCNATSTITPIFQDLGVRISPNRSKWLYAYTFVAAFGLMEILFIATAGWFLYRRGEPNNSIGYSLQPDGGGGYRYKQVLTNHFKMFTYQELKRATNNFKHLLGKGGSGEVYKGVLDDKRVVAVKRLPDAEKGIQGDEEFRAELSVIGRIYHMNLVRMWGFCTQSRRRILIYEFVENGSLDKALFLPANADPNDTADVLTSSPKLLHQQNFLNWPKRFGIALGTARGLAYLHHECLEWVIHCDIKPENILLDADYQPKIADFGLVKLTQRDSPGSHLSHIRGTKGYMAPEWTSNVPVTTKVDVYSYGIILLELLSGVRLSTGPISHMSTLYQHGTTGKQLEFRNLIQLLKERLPNSQDVQLEKGNESVSSLNIIDEFVDPKLHGDFNRMQAQVMLEVALLCTDEDRNKRPTMASVVQTLLNCCEIRYDSLKSDY